MKRVLLVMAILAITAVGAAVAYQAAAREREYRELMAQGDSALAADALAAIEDYSGALVLRPDSMLAHLKRGETYRQRGDLDNAARDFREASALDPTATRPLEQLGDTLYQQQRYKAAIDAYEARLRLDDRSGAIRYRIGLTHYRDHKPRRRPHLPARSGGPGSSVSRCPLSRWRVSAGERQSNGGLS